MKANPDPTEYGLKADAKTVWRNLSVKKLDVDSDKRTVVAMITSDAVDEEGEVVVPEGIDYSRFLKTGGVVFYNHEYDKPCGTCVAIKHTAGGIIATTKFPERPANYTGDWLPDTTFAMFASDPPIVKSFSIGFSYLETRNPNKKDYAKYGREDIKRIVSKSKLLEYSVAPLPMNADATAIQVNKRLESPGDQTDNCMSQESCTAPDCDCPSEAVGAEQTHETRPERSNSLTTPQEESTMADNFGEKGMVDLKSTMTIGELMAKMSEMDKDEAEKVRDEVEEKVAGSKMDHENEEKMKDDEEKKAKDEDKKSIQDLALQLKNLMNTNAAAQGRGRIASAMPIVTSPGYKGKLKHLGDHDMAYAMGKTVLAAAGHKSSAAWVTDRFGAKAHSELNNSLGGFFVPDELDQAIIDLRAEYGKFRANTRVLNMNRDVLQINRRAGGMTAVAVGEGGTFTESDNTFDQVKLTANKFGVLTKVSSELLEDAVINLGDYVAGEIAYAFANKEDECGFNGDGTSTFAGIQGLKNAVGSAGTKTQGTGTTIGAMVLADFAGTVGLAPEYVFSRTSPKWYMSTQFYHTVVLDLLSDAGGNTNLTLANGVAVPSLFGYEVVLVDVMPKATATDTIFAYFGALDLSSTMGDRRPTEVATSTDFAFNQDQTAIRGTTRFDIVNHDCGDSSNAGAIVALKTGS